MPTTRADLFPQAIRRTLAQRAGADPDARAVAGATIHTWQQMVAQLEPVIGARGVDAILRRALHLTSSSRPWLAFTSAQGDTAALLVHLEKHLADCAPDVAAEAGSALLVTFVKLLTALVGDSLTERLLAPVWVSALPASEQETKS